MVISNSLAEDTELHYTHSLYSEEPFLVIRAKKKKKRERVTGGASEPNILLTYNHHLWYALFPLLRKCFKKAPNFKKNTR